MQYRDLGKTGLKVSALGFGAMRLPLVDEMTRFVPNAQVRIDEPLAAAMLHKAFEAGVNYVDTSPVYCQGRSEPFLGDALKGWREKIILSTKNPDYSGDEKTWWANLEGSLEKMRTSFIDVYSHHGLNWDKYQKLVEPTLSKWMARARDHGMVRHVAASIHDTPENIIRILDTGYVEAVTVQYNLLDRKLEGAIAHAKAKGIGVVVMGPLAKGRLGRDLPAEEIRGLAPAARWWSEVALQFVWSNPNVSVALSGMMSLTDVEHNLAAAKAAALGLSPSQRERLVAWAGGLAANAGLKAIPCTECGYCVPCPNGVNIPRVFGYYNDACCLGGWEAARRAYQRWDGWNPGKRPDACQDCGRCEEKCPQKIAIRECLRKAHEALGGKPNSRPKKP